MTAVPLVTAPTLWSTLAVPSENTAERVVEVPAVMVLLAAVKLVISGLGLGAAQPANITSMPRIARPAAAASPFLNNLPIPDMDCVSKFIVVPFFPERGRMRRIPRMHPGLRIDPLLQAPSPDRRPSTSESAGKRGSRSTVLKRKSGRNRVRLFWIVFWRRKAGWNAFAEKIGYSTRSIEKNCYFSLDSSFRRHSSALSGFPQAS